MAGHSHWAGIKHKKGKADKQRSKIFSKLSKEITVAAKLGDKDPAMNPRLRSAIQAARSANMPKENIERAIDKSSVNTESNFENLRYEGFGPEKVAVIIEALTDNKNRTASSIRTIFQKAGGNLGTQGSASHNFNQLGIIKIDKKEVSDDQIFELATNAGADECKSENDFHGEITSEKMAMGHFMDGKATLVVGTHTHVPTNDTRILKKGTGYQTDAGMCGDYDSVIGMNKENSINKFLRLDAKKHYPATGDATLSGVIVDCDIKTGLANKIESYVFGGQLKNT